MRDAQALRYLTSPRFFDEEEYTQERQEGMWRMNFMRDDAQVVSGMVDSVTPDIEEKLSLCDLTRKKYEAISSGYLDLNGYGPNKVRVAHLLGDFLKDYGIHSIFFRVKYSLSIAMKVLGNFGIIYNPTQEDLDKLTIKGEKRVKAEEVYGLYEEWFSKVLEEGKDIFETICPDRKNKRKYKPSVFANDKFRDKNRFNGVLLDKLFLGTLLLDNSGVAIVTHIQKDLKEIKD